MTTHEYEAEDTLIPAEMAQVDTLLPQNVEDILAAQAALMKARIGAPSGDVIRIGQDKTFTLPSGDQSDALSVVIVDFVAMNEYYDKPFDRKDITPPVCKAIGTDLLTMRPYDESSAKQSDACAGCWANQWGSNPNGNKKGKACGNHRLLAVLAPQDQADGPIMLVKTSPTGSGKWDSYATKVLQTVGALVKVVTTITFDPGQTYATLNFTMERPNEDWNAALSRGSAALERLLVKPDLTPREAPKKVVGRK